MSDDLTRNEILSAGPDDGDWSDVLKRAKKARHRSQIYVAVALTALIVVGAASAYVLTHRGQPWCKEPTSEAWKKVLAGHVVALSRHISVGPIAVADEHSFYADIYSKSYAGVVKIDIRTNRYTEIRRDKYGVAGSAVGRWFVWADQVNGYGATRAVWAWDSRRGRLRRISRSMRSADGSWAGASTPVVRDGYATWSQGASVGERAGVHVVNLLNGRDRVVNSSGSEPFFLPGHVVAWTEDVSAPNSKNPSYVLEAANFISGRRVSLPKALRNLPSRGAATLISDGKALVYSAGPRESLWWSPSLRTDAWHVFTLNNKVGNWIESPAELAGRYVLFGAQISTGDSSYLVDVTTGGYVEVDGVFPGPLNKDAVILSAQTTIKSSHPIDAVYFIPSNSLPPIRSCYKPLTATG